LEWCYLDDPYWLGLHPENEPNDNIGRAYFAAQPGKIAVEFRDLPGATVARVRERIKAGDPALEPPRVQWPPAGDLDPYVADDLPF
jgi:hypothetical protein